MFHSDLRKARSAGELRASTALASGGDVALDAMDGDACRDAKASFHRRRCHGCGSQEELLNSFKYCADCKGVLYCSQACQKSHWNSEHKYECRQRQAVRPTR